MTWFGWKSEQQLLKSPQKSPFIDEQTAGNNGNGGDDLDRQIHKMLESPQSDVQKDLNEFRIAGLYFKNGRYTQSLQHLNNYLEANPKSAKALKMKADILDENEDHAEALEFYFQAYDYGLNMPDVTSKIKRLIGVAKESKENTLKMNLNRYLKFAHKNNIDLNTSLTSNSPMRNYTEMTSFNSGDVEAAIKSFGDSQSDAEKLALLRTLLASLKSFKSQNKSMMTKTIECLTESFIICLADLSNYHEKIMAIAECLEGFLQANFTSPCSMDDYQASLYLFVFAASLAIFENSRTKNLSVIFRNLSSVSNTLIKIAMMLFKSKYDLLSEEVSNILKSLNQLFAKEKSSLIRISSAETESLSLFIKAIGCGKTDKCFAIKIIQQTLLVGNSSTDLSIKIHHSIDKLPFIGLIFAVNDENCSVFSIISETLHFQCQNNICPANLSFDRISLWDLTLFINFMRNSSNFDAKNAQSIWTRIVNHFSEQSSMADKTLNIVKNMRSFSFDHFANILTINDFEELENCLVAETNAFKPLVKDNAEYYNYLLDLSCMSNSKYVFHNYNANLKNLINETRNNLQQAQNKSDTLTNSTCPEREDSVSLKLIDTFNKFMSIATINPQPSHANKAIEMENKSCQIRDAAESLASLSLPPNQTSMMTSTPAPKHFVEPIKETNAASSAETHKEIILCKLKCSLMLLRATKKQFHGILSIKKENNALTVQFVTEQGQITKLKTFVKFKNGMPLTPLLVQQISPCKFKWTVMDFSTSQDGSLQNSIIEFRSELKCQKFTDLLTKLQKFNCIKEDLSIIEESEEEQNDNYIQSEETQTQDDQDVIFLGEYVPPGLTDEQRKLCNELMLPLTFFEKSCDSSGEDCTDENHASHEEIVKTPEQPSAAQTETKPAEEPTKSDEPSSIFKNIALKNENKTTFASIFKSNASKDESKKESLTVPVKNLFNFELKSPSSESSKTSEVIQKPVSIFSPSKNASNDSPKPTFSLFAPNTDSNNNNNQSASQSPAESSKTVFQFSRFSAENSPSNGSATKQPEKSAAAAAEPEVTVSVADEKLEEPNATLIYHRKAKVYLFYPETEEWRGRGVGNLKVLVPDSLKGQRTAQLILRRKPFWQVSMNCLITADQEFIPVNNDAPDMTSFAVLDHSDKTPTHRYFSVRFANAENLQGFRDSLSKITGSEHDG